jgi:hypothetical protein
VTTKRQELTNELTYVMGKDRAERMVFEMIGEEAERALSEMTADGAMFEEFREHLRTYDAGHAPRTWFLLARLLQERDHQIAEKIRAQAAEKERALGRPLEVSAIERSVADRIDPKKE